MKRVVVAGAGPAGSAAAMSLVRSPGVEVLLLDRSVFPRRKVCGSGLSPWCLELLDRLGVGEMVRREAYPIHAGYIAGAEGRGVELRSKYHAAVLLRERFDTLLAHEAARRGAKFRDGVRVDEIVRDATGRLVGVKTEEGELEADAVILSSGANGRPGRDVRRPGRTLHTMVGWYEGVEGVGDAVELYFDAVVKPHYGWVFPESRDRVNIGICFVPTPGAANARERFEAFVDRRLGRRLRHATRVGPFVGHPIATTHRPTALAQQGLLVAGEAGRLVDPATAEGIHHALASGMLAGSLLGSVLSGGASPSQECLAPYTQIVREHLGKRLAAGNVFMHANRTPLLDLALRMGSSKPVQKLLTWALAGA